MAPLERLRTGMSEKSRNIWLRSLTKVDIQMLTESVSNSDSSRAAENREDSPTHSNVISGLEKIASRASIGDFVFRVALEGLCHAKPAKEPTDKTPLDERR
jgi:hypothetical protein